MKRDYHTNHEAIQKIKEEAVAKLREKDLVVQEELSRRVVNISPKVLQKRLRRIDNLCSKTLRHIDSFQHFQNYSVQLTRDEYDQEVVEIKFNGSNKPYRILSIKRTIPLYDLQSEIKRMAERVRNVESLIQGDNE